MPFPPLPRPCPALTQDPQWPSSGQLAPPIFSSQDWASPTTPREAAPRDSCQHQPPPRMGWADSAAGADTSWRQRGGEGGRGETSWSPGGMQAAAGPGKEGASGDLGRRAQDGALWVSNTSEGVSCPPAQRAVSRSLSPSGWAPHFLHPRGSVRPPALTTGHQQGSVEEPETQGPGQQRSRANLESTHAAPFPAQAQPRLLSVPVIAYPKLRLSSGCKNLSRTRKEGYGFISSQAPPRRGCRHLGERAPVLVTLLRPQLRGGGWGAVRTSQSELGSSGASPQMVGGTRAPSQRQAWGSGSSPVTPCVTSGSGHGISSLSFPILKLGVTSLGQVALGRLFGVRAGGERQTWELPSPSPRSQGRGGAEPVWAES